MHQDIEEYIPPYSLFNIFLVILFDIIIVISCLPIAGISFYEGWQNDLTIIDSGPYRFPKFGGWQGILILILLGIVCSKKNIFIKLISGTIIFAVLQWVTSNSIPDRRLEYTLLSPLKEQCYALLKMIPFTALIFCSILLILLTIFQRDLQFEPVESKANRIVILIILILFLYVIPEILRPFITIWL